MVLPLGYEHAVWLEPGTEFRRHPGSVLHPLRRAPVHVPMLWDLAAAPAGAEWGGAPCGRLLAWMREGGLANRQIWAAHAGFLIVHRDAVETFFRLAFELWHRAEHEGHRLGCEPLLAYAAQMLTGDPRWHHLSHSLDLWLPREEMHRSATGPAMSGPER